MYISATLPYSANALSAFMVTYNEAIWPLHMIAILLILTMLIALFKKFPNANRVSGLILTAFWLWTGYIFYIQEFSNLSFLAPFYGGFFLLQATLIFWFVAIQNSCNIRYVSNLKSIIGLILIAFALIFYPIIIGLYEGTWKSLRLVGITPLATSFYTLGFLLNVQCDFKKRLVLCVIPCLHILLCIVSMWLLL